MSILTLAILIPIFFSAVVVGINLLPTTSQYPLPVDISNSLVMVLGYTFAWNSIFPIDTLLTCATIGIGMELAIFTWRMIRWAIGVARGSKA
jgi:hypothetical protein